MEITMIKFYKNLDSKLTESSDNALSDKNLVWIDMIDPSKEEENEVESFFSIDVPTREEMHDIEVSSRLYSENDALYITATLITQVETGDPESHSVTFILKDKVLISLRYSDPKPFGIFLSRTARKQGASIKNNFDVLIGIMEAVVDCTSDSLKLIGIGLDDISKAIFKKNSKYRDNQTNLQDVLEKIGHYGDLNGKLSESLISLSQLFIYLVTSSDSYKKGHTKILDTYSRDIDSLDRLYRLYFK
jgi:magnesium transporter